MYTCSKCKNNLPALPGYEKATWRHCDCGHVAIKREGEESIPTIRCIVNEIGLCFEACKDGSPWRLIELQSWKDYASNGTRPYEKFYDATRQENEYFTMLDKRGIKYRRVRDCMIPS